MVELLRRLPAAADRRRRWPRHPDPARPARRDPARRPAEPAAPRTAPAPPAQAPAAPQPPAGQAPAQPAPAAAPPEPQVRGTEVRLRGAAARTAANMAASLSMPTATSVRAIPAKLLVDNRIVINNHLSRGRGGKVSFTHLIGYAILRALAVTPEMNNAFTEEDGKPVLIQPGDVNLGLAIDIRKADGSRQLLVPNIKAAQTMDFRQFWVAYEDVVRKARNGKLTVDDFAGTTISLTNPGTIGTEHSRAPPDAGPGLHRRRGRDGVPRRLPGRLGRDHRPDGHQQDRHADLDLRPPDHPGRPVRRLPAGGPPAAAGRGRLLRRDLRGAADPVRAGPLGAGHPGRPRGRHHQVRAGARADPRLPGPRSPDGRHRPAGVPPAQAPRPGHQPARPDPVGPGAGVRHRRLRRPAADAAAQYPGRAAGLLLPHGRHRVHAHPEPAGAGLDPGAGRAAARPGRQGRAAAHPVPAERGRGVRDVPADQVRRPAPVLPGGRRVADPAAGRRAHRGRPRPPGRGRPRHGPPRPAERAGQHRGQVLQPDLQRVRGQPGPGHHAWLR